MTDLWQVYKRGDARPMHPVDALGIARYLATTGYDADQLAEYQVFRAFTRIGTPAENWLEEHPAAALIAAWEAGTPAAASKRQAELHEQWPALAMALDNMAVNHAEA